MLNSLLCLRRYQAKTMVRINCLLISLLCLIKVSASTAAALRSAAIAGVEYAVLIRDWKSKDS